MAITFQNSTGGTIGTAASTWSLGNQGTLTVGGYMVVGIGCNTGVTVNSVTDDIHTYTQAVRANAPSTSSADLWYARLTSTSIGRVQMTLSAASSGAIGLGHWTGISTGRALLATGSSAISANSTTHGASEISVSSNALAVSFCRMTQSTIGTITNGNGMTTWISTNVAARLHGMYFIQGASASTISGSFTTSSNCQHAGVLAVFSDTQAPLIAAGNWLLLGVQ